MCETCPTCGRRLAKRRPVTEQGGGDDETQAELFARHKRTAPRLDLEVYIERGKRLNLTRHAAALFQRMQELHERIMAQGDSGMEKAAVWALISAFKAATIDWTEQANGCKKMRPSLPSIAGERAAAKVWELSPLMRATRRAKGAS